MYKLCFSEMVWLGNQFCVLTLESMELVVLFRIKLLIPIKPGKNIPSLDPAILVYVFPVALDWLSAFSYFFCQSRYD